MAKEKWVRNLIDILKDKASIVAAALPIKRHVSSVRLHVLRATTHGLSAPPSEARIAAVLSVGQGSHILPRVCVDALMDRLHQTRSATVALKCLFTLHNVMIKGPFTLRDQLSHYPSYGGHNFLNLSTFRDDSSMESLELTSWVRWYAGVLEQCLTVSRVLGYYLSSSSTHHNSKNAEKGVQERKPLGHTNSDLLYKLQGLVVFVEQISRVPDSLYLQRNELVYEVVKLVGEEYRSVQSEILLRVEELGKRTENLDGGDLTELLGYLKRMEESKERLILLFVNRKRNDGFWDLINQTRRKMGTKKEEMEGKWVTVRKAVRAESIGWTGFTNLFLEPGQLIAVPPGRGWAGMNRNQFALTVPSPRVG